MAHPYQDPDVGDVEVVPWTFDLALRFAKQVTGADPEDDMAFEMAVNQAVAIGDLPQVVADVLYPD